MNNKDMTMLLSNKYKQSKLISSLTNKVGERKVISIDKIILLSNIVDISYYIFTTIEVLALLASIYMLFNHINILFDAIVMTVSVIFILHFIPRIIDSAVDKYLGSRYVKYTSDGVPHAIYK